jgi:hypothetical protein
MMSVMGDGLLSQAAAIFGPGDLTVLIAEARLQVVRRI